MRAFDRPGLYLVIACALFFAGRAQAQNPVTFSIKANLASALKPGDKFTAQVTVQIQDGWHLYSLTQGAGGPIPTRITVPDGQSFKLAGTVSGPRPHVAMDPNFEINTETHEGSVDFTVPIVVITEAPQGVQTLNVNVRYQACNDKNCLPPRTVKLNTSIRVLAASALTASASPAEGSVSRSSPSPTPSGNKAMSLEHPSPAPSKLTVEPSPTKKEELPETANSPSL